MPKSVRSRIVETVAAELSKIRAGARIPGMPPGSEETFRSTVRTVTRALSADMGPEDYPAVFITDPSVSYRHILADVKAAQMRLFVSGALYDYSRKAVEELDRLIDDVSLVLSLNPTWGGLAWRTRMLALDASTEVEEPAAAFSILLEVDFPEFSAGAAEGGAVIPPRPVDVAGMSRSEQILGRLFNAFLDIPEIAWVEIPDVWPPPPEQMRRTQCPGVWFREIEELFDYRASQHAMKIKNVAILHADFEPDREAFPSCVDRAAARLKNVLGKYADLEGSVLTVDIRSIRSGRSEYPVALVDADIMIRYYQSWLES